MKSGGRFGHHGRHCGWDDKLGWVSLGARLGHQFATKGHSSENRDVDFHMRAVENFENWRMCQIEVRETVRG
jgi:hypothetical protein